MAGSQETLGTAAPVVTPIDDVVPVGADYESMPKELLIRILRLKDADRPVGLVWERNEIDHETALADRFPVAEIITKLCNGNAPYQNLIIEGDNFEVLKLLAMTHSGQIRCIYIDPPYNRGNNDFVYRDRFVGLYDRYRHSTWLEFMHRHLILARRLLADDGVIFVSIDENEIGHTRILMDQTFTGMRVGSLVWRRRGNNNASPDYFFSQDHEYILIYAGPKFSFDGSKKRWSGYANPDNDPRGDWASDNLRLGFNRQQRPNLFYPLHDPSQDIWHPCNLNRVWCYAQRQPEGRRRVRTMLMSEFIAEGRILFPQDDEPVTYAGLADLIAAVLDGSAPENLVALRQAILDEQGQVDLRAAERELGFWVGRRTGRGTPRFKRFKSDLRHATQPLSSWVRPAADNESDELTDRHVVVSGYSDEGTKVLRKLFEESPFNYPKPLSLLAELVRQSTGPEDIVLDFFAGSGTTAHAVMAVNAEDGGNRRFIMVSHPEVIRGGVAYNLCRDVLRERIARAADDLGVDASAAYLRIGSIDASNLLYELSDAHAWIFACLHEGMPVQAPSGDTLSSMVSAGGRHLVYCRHPDEALIQRVNATPRTEPVTVWTWAPGQIEGAFEREVAVIQAPAKLRALFRNLAP